MTGWRLGWMVIPEAYVRDIEKLAQNLTLCPSRRRNTPRWPLSSRKPSPSSKPGAPSFAAAGISSPRRWSASASGSPPARKAPSIFIAIVRAVRRQLRWPATCWKRPASPPRPGWIFGSNAPEKHIRFAYTTSVDRLAEAVERLALLRPASLTRDSERARRASRKHGPGSVLRPGATWQWPAMAAIG
jgi:hypothetical protein